LVVYRLPEILFQQELHRKDIKLVSQESEVVDQLYLVLVSKMEVDSFRLLSNNIFGVLLLFPQQLQLGERAWIAIFRQISMVATKKKLRMMRACRAQLHLRVSPQTCHRVRLVSQVSPLCFN
jgi:hypothetical protein